MTRKLATAACGAAFVLAAISPVLADDPFAGAEPFQGVAAVDQRALEEIRGGMLTEVPSRLPVPTSMPPGDRSLSEVELDRGLIEITPPDIELTPAERPEKIVISSTSVD